MSDAVLIKSWQYFKRMWKLTINLQSCQNKIYSVDTIKHTVISLFSIFIIRQSYIHHIRASIINIKDFMCFFYFQTREIKKNYPKESCLLLKIVNHICGMFFYQLLLLSFWKYLHSSICPLSMCRNYTTMFLFISNLLHTDNWILEKLFPNICWENVNKSYLSPIIKLFDVFLDDVFLEQC